jgi:hypothetical protein
MQYYHYQAATKEQPSLKALGLKMLDDYLYSSVMTVAQHERSSSAIAQPFTKLHVAFAKAQICIC